MKHDQYSFIADDSAAFWKGVSLGVLIGATTMFFLLLSVGAYFNL